MTASAPIGSAGPESAVRAALVAVREMKARLRAREREPIALIGIGCRFPGGGDGPDGFWQMLCEGVDAVAPIPGDRWDVEAFHDPDPAVPGKSYCRHAALLPEVRTFDAAFFNIAPREAATLDPQQRLLLETGWEALEHAGIAADRLVGSRTGLFVGTMNHDYDTLVRRSVDPAALDAYVGTGTGTSFQAGRLAYVLGVTGPALAVDTACSSSALAVHLACQSLRAGECDLALAGAANLILVPDTFITMARLKALAPDGRCKTFDAAADGYGRGEGAGMVALKRLSDARAAGDRIIAVIAGSAVNHGGAAAGLTVPSGAAQQAVIQAALAQAEMPAHSIGYVEAHGTGTPLGDPIEIAALAAVQQGRPADRPLLVGTLKTNIGHLEAAAGIAAVIKVALMLHHGRVPPHLHVRRTNPAIDLAAVPALVPTRLSDWPDSGEPRRAGVSAFGMSGTNVHLVLHSPAADDPLPGAGETSADGAQLIALSARDDAALAELSARTALALRASSAAPLADIAWTLAVGRSGHERRLAVVAGSAADAAARLDSGDGLHRGQAPLGARTRVAFLFSGQGAQYAGMAAGLYRDEPVFRAVVDRCLAALQGRLDPPLAEVLWRTSDPRINDTAYAQPALFVVQAGLVAVWRSLGVDPDLVLGHSVGEFAAAWTAGVLTLEDAVCLVAERGRLMQALPEGGAMIAAFAGVAALQPLLAVGAGAVVVAGLNGPAETMLSGDAAAMARVGTALDGCGIRWKRLPVSHAFHSPRMDAIVAPFAATADRVAAQAPKLPWVSTVTGRLVDQAPDGGYWGRQVREPVAFSAALDALPGRRIGCVIEIGPSPTLVALARRDRPDLPVTWLASLRRGADDRRSLLDAAAGAWTAGAAVRLAALHPVQGRRRVTLPGYPFQRRRHWIAEAPPTAHALPPLYSVAWEAVRLPAAERAPAGRWLVVPDAGGVADALQAAGLAFDRIDPAAWAERAADHAGAGILHLAALDLAPWALGEALRPALEGALTLVKTVATRGADAPPMLWATRAVQAVAAAPQAAAGATLWGLGRTAALEQPEIAPVLLDLPAAASPEALAAAILELLPRLDACRHAGELQWAWREREGWHAARLAPLTYAGAAVSIRPDRAYLVTGGTRGVGLAVAQDLARRGARHVLLAGRTRPDPEVLAGFERAGVRAYPLQADIAVRGALEAAVAGARAAGAPPLAGVVHAAGLLLDGVLAGQDWPAFTAVLAPKADGLAAVLAASADADLDFMVLFASGAGVLGSAGQGNYAAANAYLDAAAAMLTATGRRTLSLAWGPWNGMGMTATTAGGANPGWARKGVHALAPEVGLAAFAALAGGQSALAVLPFDWTAYRAVDRSAFLDRLAPRDAVALSRGGALAVQLAAVMPGERLALAEREVWAVVRAVLALPDGTHADPDRPLNAFGMDSLMALTVRADLAVLIGRPLPATLTYDHPTLAQLARFLVGDMLGLLPAIDEVSKPAPRPAPALREQAAAMDDADLHAYVQRKLAARRGAGA